MVPNCDWYYTMCEQMILASHNYSDWMLDQMEAFNELVEVTCG